MSIALLKKSSSKTIEHLKDAAQAKTKSSYTPDSRFWKPTLDKDTGTGFAVVRFLPAPEGEDLPFQTVFRYDFFNPETGKYYQENSLVSIGKSDPYAEFSKRLWDSGIPANQDLCRKRTRQVKRYVNVLVIDDKQHPENNGKVFLYESGPAIWKIVTAQLNPPPPEFEDEQPKAAVDVFHAFEGADFVFRLVSKEIVGRNGKNIVVPDYDKSSFRDPSPLCGGDEEKILSVWGKCHKLVPFVSESNFKTEEQLRTRIVEVLGTSVNGVPVVIGGAVAPAAAASTPAPQERTQAAPSAPSVDDFDEDLPEDFGTTKSTEAAATPAASTSTPDDDFLNSLLDD